jgi:hypothetical protein
VENGTETNPCNVPRSPDNVTIGVDLELDDELESENAI